MRGPLHAIHMLAISAAPFPSLPATGTRLPAAVVWRRTMTLPSPLHHSTTSSSPPSEEEGASEKPWLIVGLGNPGKKFRGTRHNVGFEMLDAIAEAEGIPVSTTRFKALTGKGFIGDKSVVFVKPQTFMNSSGDSVSEVVRYYDIPLNQVLVMYDDLDLPFASLRLLPKGGHGGHNGMRSIISRFKERRDFLRLRIGIGRPPGKMNPISFVMRPFNKNEYEELAFAYQTGIEAVRILLLQGFDRSATFVNSANSSKILNA